MAAAMQTSRNGKLFRCCREAMALGAYQDGKHCSIGFGSNSPALRLGDVITPTEAFALLDRDTAVRDAEINRALKVQLLQHQYDAVGSFYYQNANKPDGQGRPGFRTLVKLINSGDMDAAAAYFPECDRDSAGVSHSGLHDRRLLEQKLFLTGDYGDLSKFPMYAGNPHETKRQTYYVKAEDLA
jgi:GH24 family phage-related lysozyme (muramidase)